ncbi:glycoprotein precursor [Wuhan Fly Virus 1]|uniref:Glycoprotein n=1 Tax=Wuhan Fly Virus 1 TaxID=1608101 RepID=A0A0B5KU03_9VIRU|nr:glycoprotein precursor [Wuhan Fly Virus 1]AJG39292.1 glycoprotein precursor [Wuhan Fly Virus 1]
MKMNLFLSIFLFILHPLLNAVSDDGLVINFILGGTVDKITHVDRSTNYNVELTKFATALVNETCDGVSLLDFVDTILKKKGIINFDLRKLAFNSSTLEHLNKGLTKEEQEIFKEELGKTLLDHHELEDLEMVERKAKKLASENRSSNLRKAESPFVGSEFSNYINFDSAQPLVQGHVEILSSKGTHQESAKTGFSNIGEFNSDSPKNYSESNKLSDQILYHTMERLSKSYARLCLKGNTPISPISNPIDIVNAYVRARKMMFDSEKKSTMGLLIDLRDSIENYVDLIKIKDHGKIPSNYTMVRSMIADEPSFNISAYLNNIDEEIAEHEVKLRINHNYLLMLKHKKALLTEPKIRKRRNYDFVHGSNVDVFTGVKPGDFDVRHYVEKELQYNKMTIANTAFGANFWPECEEKMPSATAILSEKPSRSILMAFVKSDGICFISRFCGPSEHVSPSTLLCEPSTELTVEHQTNILKLGVSDYIHKLSVNLDNSLARQFKGYCSVGDLVIETCHDSISSVEEISVGRISGEWQILKNDLQYGYLPDLSKITSYSCTASNISQLQDPEHPGYINGCMKGDETYLRHFKGDKDCSCEVSKQAGSISARYYEKLVPIDFLVHFKVNVKKPMTLMVRQKCKDCIMTCKEGNIQLTNIPKYDLLSVCKKSLCEYFQIKSQKEGFKLSYPKPLLGNVTYRLYPNDTSLEPYVSSTFCTIEEFCNLITCVLCKEFLMNPHCNPVAVIAVWSMLLIVPILLLNIITSMLSVIFKIIGFVFKVFKIVFKCIVLLFKSCTNISKKKANKAYTALSDAAKMDTEMIEVKEIRPRYTNVPQRAPLKPIVVKPIYPIVILTIIVVFLDSALSCSVESVITTDSMHCTSQGMGAECLIKQDIMLSLAPIGQVSCINIRGQNSMEVLNQIQIKTIGLRLACNPVTLYYTSNVKPSISSTYRCSGAGSCNEDHCKSVKPDDQLVDIPNKHLFSITGESGCKLVNGFWGNGCFLAESACKYYRVFYQPIGDTYEIFNCPTWEWYAEVNVTTIGSSAKTTTMHISSSQPYASETFTIRLTSVSLKPNVFYSKCFMKKSSVRFEGHPIATAPCNVKSESTIGKVGEIQCPMPKDADDMTTRCSFIKGLHEVSTNGNDISFKASVLNIDEIYSANLLPKQFTGLTIEQTSRNIPYINSHEAALFTLHISMNGYKVEILESRIECGTNFVNLTGCYRCDSGARLCLDTSATSYPAVFRMSCPNVIPQLKTIENKGIWCTNVPFNKERVNTECETSCGVNKQSVKVSGTLIYIPSKLPSYQNETIIDNEVQESFVQSFIKWFSSLSWITYLYMAVSLIIGLVVCYILIRIIVPIVFSCLKRVFRRKSASQNGMMKQHDV